MVCVGNNQEEEQELDEILKELYGKWLINFNSESGENLRLTNKKAQKVFMDEIAARLEDLY